MCENSEASSSVVVVTFLLFYLVLYSEKRAVKLIVAEVQLKFGGGEGSQGKNRDSALHGKPL